MRNIINDIVEDIDIKPNKTKIVFRWVLTIAVMLIGLAFAFGQFKSSFFNRMDEFETSLMKNTEAIEVLGKTSVVGFEQVNTRIDKVYDDGLKMSKEFQENNIQQLELIIDYGSSNKDMLKRMLRINSLNLETQVNRAKNENLVIEKPKEYIGIVYIIGMETNDTTFGITGATQKFIDDIDKDKYIVESINKNNEYPNRFDFSYHNK